MATQGIGDSAQGFANFLLFCVFTKKVRNKYTGLVGRAFCWNDYYSGTSRVPRVVLFVVLRVACRVI
jgi:glutamine synthetase type III